MEITTRLLLLSGQSLPRAGLLFDIPNRYPFVDRVGKHDGQPQLLQYIQGPVDLFSDSIEGGETVTSKQGTATVTVLEGKLSVGSGTLWSFSLSNGSQYEFGSGGWAWDVSGNDRPLSVPVAACVEGREFGSNWPDTVGWSASNGEFAVGVNESEDVGEYITNGVLVPALADKSGCCAYLSDTPLVSVMDSSPSAFFNGMDFRLATYTGGPTYVPDHLGVLRSPRDNKPAVHGMRLEWIEDSHELITNGDFSSGATGWIPASTGGAGAIESGGLAVTPTVASTVQGMGKAITCRVGKLHRVTVNLKYTTTINRYLRIAASTNPSAESINFDNNKFLLGINDYFFIATATEHYVFFCVYSTITADKIIVDDVSIKEVIPTYLNTDESGNPILPSTPQKTVTYNTDWTAKTFAETFEKFDTSDPLKAPGWLCEPPRTNAARPSSVPITHTTGTIAVGTYTLWQEGTGAVVATAGTAVGTFGTASNGAPATITITTAGTVVLTTSGTNTWVQLEPGAFKTSRIYTTTAPVTRAATIASFSTDGKIPVNNFAIRMIVVPRASGQSGVYCFGSYVDSGNYIAIIVNPTSITVRKRVSGVDTDATVSITHAIGVPLDLILYSSPMSGMQISIRSFSSSWGIFADGTVNETEAAKANASIAATYRLGDLNGSQFTGNISLFDCVPIPSGITDPMAWAKTHWGVV